MYGCVPPCACTTAAPRFLDAPCILSAEIHVEDWVTCIFSSCHLNDAIASIDITPCVSQIDKYLAFAVELTALVSSHYH